MDSYAFFEAKIACLILSWIERHQLDKSLYDLCFDFLETVSAEKGRLERKEYPATCRVVNEYREACVSKLTKIAEQACENPALSTLAARFKLDRPETSLIEFILLYLRCDPLEQYFDKLPIFDQLNRLAFFSGANIEAVITALQKNGKLMRLGIGADLCHAFRMSRHEISFGISEAVLSFLGCGGTSSLSAFLMEIPKRPTLPLEAFDLPKVTIVAAKTILSSRNSKQAVLLYGKPGTGKTEFARSLCESMGARACFLSQSKSEGINRFENLILCAKVIDPVNEVLIVDEADGLLNTESCLFDPPSEGTTKSKLNDFFDSTEARLIFISNKTKRISDSVARRFGLHIKFEDHGPMRRERIWNALSGENGPFTEDERRYLASQYKANPARVRQVVEACSSLDAQAKGGVGAFELAKDMLARSDELMYGLARSEDERDARYDSRFLKTACPVDELIRSLDVWKERFRTDRKGLNMLFYGAPGTGKTAFARHIADHLDLFPLIKRASDLLSPWVGETEANIRSAFREAEGAMLIFDEADSILSERRLARMNWERSQTNEILTGMESFNGLFVAATNFRTILDSASLRRFAFKVEFLAPEPCMRIELVSAYFPGFSWRPEELTALEQMPDIFPGDVAAIAARLNLSRALDPAKILAALREETTFRESGAARIGF